MGHFPERNNRFKAQSVVLALGIYFADVNLLDPAAEALQNLRGFAHSGVDLAGMPNVEAEGSVRQALEDSSEIAGRLADRLPFVHVLDAESISESCPALGV